MDRTLLSILAGLGGMLGWGTSDFLANSASEKVGHTKALFWSQMAGAILITILFLIFLPNFSMPLHLLLLTFLGGVVYALGYLFFYKAFEIGNVSVISAVSNLHVLFIIAVSFFIRGQELTILQIPALAILLAGVTLVSLNFKELKDGKLSLLRGVKEVLIAAVLFGVIYWPLNEFIAEQANWIVVSLITKLIAILAVFVFMSMKKEKISVVGSSRRLVLLLAAIGVLEAIAVLSVTFGQSYGEGIIVAPISSALTVVTVGLAVIFTKERINNIQGLGIAMVVVGIVLTAF